MGGFLGFVLNALYILICLFLIMIILLQSGRGGGLAGAFGGGGMGDSAFGVRTASRIGRITIVAAVIFFVLVVLFNILGKRHAPVLTIPGSSSSTTAATIGGDLQGTAEEPTEVDTATGPPAETADETDAGGGGAEPSERGTGGTD